jgi:putative endonuclease
MTLPRKTRIKKTHQFGLFAEKIAMIFLRLKGYQILEWRYKTRFGEIDIIAKKSRIIACIEVKARRSKIEISAVLRPHQILRIKQAAEFFLYQNPQFSTHQFRFDFIEVGASFLPKHYKNFLC